jgi:hypothetical protein
MSPQMNANERKCKTRKYDGCAYFTGMDFVIIYRGLHVQENIRVYSRSLADWNRHV